MRKKRDDIFYSESGSELKQTFVAVQTLNGTFDLVPGDIINIQEEIDSHAESCSIENIIALCAAGDTSALNRVQGSYIDASVMPKTYRDLLDTVITGRRQFDSLPISIRQKFDSNFMTWFSEAGTPEWIEKMEFVQPSVAEKKDVSKDAE